MLYSSTMIVYFDEILVLIVAIKAEFIASFTHWFPRIEVDYSLLITGLVNAYSESNQVAINFALR